MILKSIRDINGKEVFEGNIVKVLAFAEGLFINMPEDEVPRVKSMLNEELEVEEICEYGLAWVYKYWPEGEGRCSCHGLGLEPNEMQLVANNKNKKKQ